MGIDIGTTGCKAAVYAPTGEMLAYAYNEYDIIRALPGQAELNCREVWKKTSQVISACVKATGDIRALSVTSMGEALVPIDRRGRICGDSVLGTDARGAGYLEQLIRKLPPAELYEITGQPASLGYSLPNLMRLMNKEPNLYRQTCQYLPWSDFVTYMLTGNRNVNFSQAARILLFDKNSNCYSQRVADAADFDLEKLPSPMPSGISCGRIHAGAGKLLGLSEDVLVVSGSHDQCAATIGSGVNRLDAAMLGLGTYACMVLVSDSRQADSLPVRMKLNLEPHAVAPQYVSFIYHGSGGALVKWFRNEMFRDFRGGKAYRRMDLAIDPDKISPTVLPYWEDSGLPECVSGGHGVIAGLSLSHSRADILKGAMEGCIFYFKSALDRVRAGASQINRLQLSGGGAESEVWCQMVADILDMPVSRPVIRECGTLGAAIIAGAGAGVFSSIAEAIDQMVRNETTFLPEPKRKGQYEQAYGAYRRLRESVADQLER